MSSEEENAVSKTEDREPERDAETSAAESDAETTTPSEGADGSRAADGGGEPATAAGEDAGDAVGEPVAESSGEDVKPGASGPEARGGEDDQGDREPGENDRDSGGAGADGETGDGSANGEHRERPAAGPGKLALVVVLPLVFVSGYVVARLVQSPARAAKDGGSSDGSNSETPEKTQLWTCSMHPQFKLPKPGKCPICAMDLIPMDESGSSDSGPTLTLSEAAAKLAEIQTARVKRDWAEAELRFVGKVAFDETRVKTITSWVPGRLDRLFVDYTGVAVRKGDHLVEIYSPELITAQEELLQAMRSVEELKGGPSERVLESARASVKAARERLELLGVTAEQLASLERTKTVSDHLTIFAPRGGIVVHKNAMEGSYVKTGSPIYRIADLSVVWVNLEAYESDLAWLRFGQAVSFRTEAFPGEEFEGRISFIDPILDDRTRTVMVRVNVPNADGRLKPGMFVRATVLARMSEGGVVMDPTLADKWISPMHPEIVKDEPGDCDVCGMPLVQAESLGLASTTTGSVRLPLLVPSSAVLLTGKRAVVYVRTSSEQEPPKFEGRVIRLGARAGEHYVVRGGLKQGEIVVTHGAFKIDSALQIQAKTSMMLPAEEKSGESSEPDGEDTAAGAAAARLKLEPEQRRRLLTVLEPVLREVLAVQRALASDAPGDAERAAKSLKSKLGPLAKAASGPVAWLRIERDLRRAVMRLAAARTLTVQREAFSSVSQGLIVALRGLGTPRPLDLIECPMAFGGVGGRWLQAPGEIANPYFGASMLRCGDVKQRLRPGEDSGASMKGHDGDHGTHDKPGKAPEVGMSGLLDDWLALQTALAGDDAAASAKAAKALAKRLKPTDLAGKAKAVADAEGLAGMRGELGPLAGALVRQVTARGSDRALIHAHCPMARDGKGGDWLQRPGELRNPYFGSAMLTCGDVVKELDKTVENDASPKSPPQKGSEETPGRSPKVGMSGVLDDWLALQTALAGDDAAASAKAAKALAKRLKPTDLAGKAKAVADAEGLAGMRGELGPLAGALVRQVTARGSDRALIHAHCPMARDGKGGDWLQRPGELRNPYFGSAMLTCGDVVKELDKTVEASSGSGAKPDPASSSQPTSKPASRPAGR